MNLTDLILKTRSYRRFDENYVVSFEELKDMVNCARLGASARNQQSLKYLIVNGSAGINNVFPLLKWAGYLSEWEGPVEGERPTGYIIVVNDRTIAENHFCDEGIALQNMMLCATSKGLGSCIIASVNKSKLRDSLNLADDYEVLNVLAVGKPNEKIVIENMVDDDYKYWRDEVQVHHVPKRSLDQIIINTDKGV
jgi:nitroreductase